MFIYHAIVTALFMYASPVFGCLPLKLLSKIERFQKRAHRIICGSDCSCKLFPPIPSRLLEAAVRLLLISEANPSHPLYAYVPRRLPASNRLAMPMCATSRWLRSFFPFVIEFYNSQFNHWFRSVSFLSLYATVFMYIETILCDLCDFYYTK